MRKFLDRNPPTRPNTDIPLHNMTRHCIEEISKVYGIIPWEDFQVPCDSKEGKLIVFDPQPNTEPNQNTQKWAKDALEA